MCQIRTATPHPKCGMLPLQYTLYRKLIVLGVGLEPTRSQDHCSLNAACLPIPPSELFKITTLCVFTLNAQRAIMHIEMLVVDLAVKHDLIP